MHTLLHDIAAAVTVVRIVVGVVRVTPVVITGSPETAGEENAAAAMEAMVEAAVSKATAEIAGRKAVALHGANVASRCVREAVEIAAAGTARGEAATAKTTGVATAEAATTETTSVTAAEAATTKAAGMATATAESTTSAAVATATAAAAATATAGQGHVRRQRGN
jgi:hypothetical protein